MAGFWARDVAKLGALTLLGMSGVGLGLGCQSAPGPTAVPLRAPQPASPAPLPVLTADLAPSGQGPQLAPPALRVRLRGELLMDPAQRLRVADNRPLICLVPIAEDLAVRGVVHKDCRSGLCGLGPIHLRLGETLCLHNVDRIHHSFFRPGYGRRATGGMRRGPTGPDGFRFRPKQAGVYRLYCRLHRGEHVDVFVHPKGMLRRCAPGGRFLFEEVPVGEYQLYVLHPELPLVTQSLVLGQEGPADVLQVRVAQPGKAQPAEPQPGR